MPQLIASILDQVRPTTLLDIGITALLIYWLFSLIRGTRAVRLVIGVSILFAVYFVARFLQLRLLTQILETGAVVGLFALVVVFQPEIRRALDRIGRVGSLSWLFSAEGRTADIVATEVARAASLLSAEGHGALIVLERETGLEEIAETGVLIHGDLSADLLRTIFTPRSALHDGAVIIRETSILAAGSLLPLAETTVHTERFGTRHRAALGITEQTDAVVVVVSEENGQISLVQRARIVRNLNEAQLARSIRSLLQPSGDHARVRIGSTTPGGRAPRLADLGRLVRRDSSNGAPAKAEALPTPEVPAADGSPAPEAAPAAEPAAAEAVATAPVEESAATAAPRP
ncbi:MAG TPA: diadenylate cyclase CdaA [Candidatus Limnocylindrales bacterium]|nr:diadenylate cyclase CdaA [Candidatus Limnocylindrales bacterium]